MSIRMTDLKKELCIRCILKSILKHFLMQLFCTSLLLLSSIKPKFLTFFLRKKKSYQNARIYRGVEVYLSVYALNPT